MCYNCVVILLFVKIYIRVKHNDSKMRIYQILTYEIYLNNIIAHPNQTRKMNFLIKENILNGFITYKPTLPPLILHPIINRSTILTIGRDASILFQRRHLDFPMHLSNMFSVGSFIGNSYIH